MDTQSTPGKINKRTKAGNAALSLRDEHNLSEQATWDIYQILRTWGKRKKAPPPDWMPYEECVDIWNDHHKKHNDGVGADWNAQAGAGMKGILKQIHRKLQANKNFKNKTDGEFRDQIMTSFSWICETRDKFPPAEFFWTWDLGFLNRRFSDFYRKLALYGQGITKDDFAAANSAAVRARVNGQAG